MSSKSRVIADDDPTIEEEAPDFDPTRTDALLRASEVSIVATSDDSVGAIEHDDRGEARWKWVTETADALASEKTFDHLKSLSNDRLAIEDIPPLADAEKPSRKTGYNPYDVDGPAAQAKPKTTKPQKPRK